MYSYKTIHIGGISNLDNYIIYVTIKSTRHDVVYQLNNWLFDYLYPRDMKILQLPPMDDWVRSPEDETYWSCNLPDMDWTIWTRSESLSF
jgi:hypothetical protein